MSSVQACSEDNDVMNLGLILTIYKVVPVADVTRRTFKKPSLLQGTTQPNDSSERIVGKFRGKQPNRDLDQIAL